MSKRTLEEMREEAIEMLENDDELFCNMVEELDSWNGYADGYRCYDMSEIDDLFCGCSIGEFLDKLGNDFNHRDNYFVDTIYGIESTDYREDVYRDNTTAEEVLDAVLDNYPHLWFSDTDFKDLIEEIDNYDEEDDETDESEDEEIEA